MNELLPKTIAELLHLRFFIPSYQRGYRWKSDTQVKELLQDIWNYQIDSNNANAFYCLQPVVVRKNADSQYELIDGQQRLTTIMLILHHMNETEFRKHKPVYSIEFETRIGQNDFLSFIHDEDVCENDVDLFHLNQAYKYISEWFEEGEVNAPAIRTDFYSKLVSHVRVIWYELLDETNAVDIFTRLNVGKIPLTNAELIKALFLSRATDTEERFKLKQLIIASEWDRIEQTLQKEEFWYFICNKPDAYDTRIEFIFDLIHKKKPNDEGHYTFYRFYNELKSGDTESVDASWLRVKAYFLTLENWFEDHTFYHLVGFLVATGVDLNELKEFSARLTKSTFRDHLLQRAMKAASFELEELDYSEPKDKPKIRKVLLLFNILTILKNKDATLRFPFNFFHGQSWDLEHIRSQKDKDLRGKDRIEWAIHVLDYFVGCKWNGQNEDLIRSEMTKLKPDEASYCEALLSIIKFEEQDDVLFTKVFHELSVYFKEEEGFDEPNGVGNLTLLDAKTNRSYKNAFFPVKRKFIIDREKAGVFIPLCTKNVFLKAYSNKLGDLMSWKPSDADAYFTELQNTVQP